MMNFTGKRIHVFSKINTEMRRRKRNNIGVCAFCGIKGEVTEDHIPPKNLFIGCPDSGLIKVPSCDPCNNRSKLDDEYFRLFLIPQQEIALHPQAQKLNNKVRKKFDDNPRKGLEIRMYSQLHTKDFYTPAGIYLGKKDLIYPEYSRIEASLKKIIKGLYFHLVQRPFPFGLCNTAVIDIRQIHDLQKVLRLDLDQCVKALAKYPTVDIYDVFSYKYVVSVDTQPAITAWILTFFEKRKFFGVTYPKGIGNEVTLLDADPNEIISIPF